MSKQQHKYELVYFRFRGKANLIRLVMADQGIAYSESNVSMDDWATAKAKYPFGQLPVLIVDGETVIAQSHTIARFVADQCGLLGSNSLERAQVEMWIDQTSDVRNKFYDMVMTNLEAGLQPFIASLSSLLAPFVSRLAAQPDRSKHLALGRLTLADYALFDLLFIMRALKLEADILAGTPSLQEFYAGFMAERSGLRAYMESDEFKALKTSRSPLFA